MDLIWITHGAHLPRTTCSNLGLKGFLARDEEKRGGLIKTTAACFDTRLLTMWVSR